VTATVDCVNEPPPPRSVLELSVFDLPGSNDALEKGKEVRSYYYHYYFVITVTIIIILL
jgi:hypothetical protein